MIVEQAGCRTAAQPSVWKDSELMRCDWPVIGGDLSGEAGGGSDCLRFSALLQGSRDASFRQQQ